MEQQEGKIRFTEETVDNGFFVNLLVNTKGKGVPVYVMSFIASQIKETRRVFDVPCIFDLTGSVEEFAKKYDHINTKRDTILQIVCKVNLDLSEKDFSTYMGAIVNDTLIPFFVGCNFEVMSWYFQFNLPRNMIGVRWGGGEKSVTFSYNKMPNSLRLIFTDLFGLDEYAVEKIDGYFDMVGQFTLEDCIKGEDIPVMSAFFDKVGIKYEVI